MIGTDVSVAKDLLESGKLVAIPTETVYGLAANALDPDAILSIFKAKNRPSFDPLIVHISSLDWVDKLTTSFPINAKKLAETFWPGPLTLILPKSELVLDIVTSGLPFVGIRMPRHELTRELLTQLSFPLAAPSANPFSYVSPTAAQHVADQLGDKIPYILDGGDSIIGLESTIISFENPNQPAILRFGGITQQEIEKEIGKVTVSISNNSNPTAPGQLDKHYATTKKTHLVKHVYELLQFDEATFCIGYGEGIFDYNLSPTSNMDEMASQLFKALRKADDSNKDEVAIAIVPDTGIGKAINDRITRASK